MDKPSETHRNAQNALLIAEIMEADWRYLRDHLAAKGWQVSKGGGLDHSWARLRKGRLWVDMEYDRWAEGEVRFAAADRDEVLADFPDDLLEAYPFVDR